MIASSAVTFVLPAAAAAGGLASSHAYANGASSARTVTVNSDSVAAVSVSGVDKTRTRCQSRKRHATVKEITSVEVDRWHTGSSHLRGQPLVAAPSGHQRRVQLTAVQSGMADVPAEVGRGGTEENGAGAELGPVTYADDDEDILEKMRTKGLKKLKPGEKMAEFLGLMLGLLDRPFGSGQGIAAAGSVVLEKVRADAEVLNDVDGVNQQYVFEFLRVTKLLMLDMEMVASARKMETLLERLEQAKGHCRQAIDIANAL